MSTKTKIILAVVAAALVMVIVMVLLFTPSQDQQSSAAVDKTVTEFIAKWGNSSNPSAPEYISGWSKYSTKEFADKYSSGAQAIGNSRYGGQLSEGPITFKTEKFTIYEIDDRAGKAEVGVIGLKTVKAQTVRQLLEISLVKQTSWLVDDVIVKSETDV